MVWDLKLLIIFVLYGEFYCLRDVVVQLTVMFS